MNPIPSIDRAPRRSWRRPAVALGTIGVALLSGCGSSKSAATATTLSLSTTVTVTSDGSTAGAVIAEVWAEQLEAANVRVARKAPITGGRAATYPALANNQAQLMPETTNGLLLHVLQASNPSATVDPAVKTVDDQIAALKKALPSTLTVGTATAGDEAPVVACTQAVAEKSSLATLTDLGKVADQITLGGPAELQTSTPFGIDGLKATYSATFKAFTPLAATDVADKLKAGTIDCGVIASTSTAIVDDGFVVLDDDKSLIPKDVVIPLITTAAATPTVTSTLDAIAAKLTTEVLKSLVYKVEVGKQTPEQAAKAFVATLSSSSSSGASSTGS